MRLPSRAFGSLRQPNGRSEGRGGAEERNGDVPVGLATVTSPIARIHGKLLGYRLRHQGHLPCKDALSYATTHHKSTLGGRDVPGQCYGHLWLGQYKWHPLKTRGGKIFRQAKEGRRAFMTLQAVAGAGLGSRLRTQQRRGSSLVGPSAAPAHRTNPAKVQRRVCRYRASTKRPSLTSTITMESTPRPLWSSGDRL